jgi:hypothetical protein
MAEKVTHGVNGLHALAGSAADLARTIQQAATTPGLWEQLRAGIPPVHTVQDSVRTIEALYRRLIEARRAAPADDELAPDVSAVTP